MQGAGPDMLVPVKVTHYNSMLLTGRMLRGELKQASFGFFLPVGTPCTIPTSRFRIAYMTNCDSFYDAAEYNDSSLKVCLPSTS